MNYRFISHGRCIVLYLSGNIEAGAIHQLRSELSGVLPRTGEPLIIDACDISAKENQMVYVAGLLNAIRREIDYRSGLLQIGSVPVFLRNYLERTGIDLLFSISGDTCKAIELFKAGGDHEYNRTA